MAKLPMDDIEKLWNETTQRDWSSFKQTLQKHKGKTEGISDNIIDAMMQFSDEMAGSNKPYPSSAQDMYNVLSQRIAQTQAR